MGSARLEGIKSLHGFPSLNSIMETTWMAQKYSPYALQFILHCNYEMFSIFNV